MDAFLGLPLARSKLPFEFACHNKWTKAESLDSVINLV